ncbi:hypothetical protein LR48_Vigan04g133800 [Vigna angularis]|uniref:Uncharacterized protein n=1 Tax=Phaseolus angularis TaxID=3914 RepID=A0A0L9UDY2_PHAAN|nr:hypothetical protein LR48_Vigan04g133800 [Vigna angularis]
MSLRKQMGKASSSNRAPRPAPLSRAPVGTPNCSPSTGAEATGVAEVTQPQSQVQPPPMIRTVVEPLSEVEVTNALLELSTRASMLAWYLREFTDRCGVKHVQEELVAERKVSADLRDEVEALRVTHERCEKKKGDLQLELDEARQQLGQTADFLKDARARNDRLTEECDQLKVSATKQAEREEELVFETKAL